ncbi:hypothetical protein GGF32_007366 [Allomyces javanicus]|nr:hypothetical protein GGF32_007366 [Allomyces javanicus]
MDHSTTAPAANEHQAPGQVSDPGEPMQVDAGPHAPGHSMMTTTTAATAEDSRGKKRAREEMDDDAPATT